MQAIFWQSKIILVMFFKHDKYWKKNLGQLSNLYRAAKRIISDQEQKRERERMILKLSIMVQDNASKKDFFFPCLLL